MDNRGITTAKLLVVVGMPGSGKSTYLHDLIRTKTVDVVFDDFQKDSQDDDYDDPRKSQFFARMIASLTDGKTVAVADRRYCVEAELQTFLAAVFADLATIDTELHYFENSSAACERNIRRRNRAGYVQSELEFLHGTSTTYAPPESGLLPIVGS